MEGKSSLILNRWGIVKTIPLFVCGYISRLLTINVVVRENLEKFPSTPNASNTPTPPLPSFDFCCVAGWNYRYIFILLFYNSNLKLSDKWKNFRPSELYFSTICVL